MQLVDRFLTGSKWCLERGQAHAVFPTATFARLLPRAPRVSPQRLSPIPRGDKVEGAAGLRGSQGRLRLAAEASRRVHLYGIR